MAEAPYVPRFKARYRDELVAALKDELGFTNVMQVPRVEKIVVNMGVGDAIKDGRMLDAALEDLTTITGQKPVVTKARKSIAGFKLREGMSIGAKVTLRGDRMWEFLDRLVSLALPRIRDFRGLDPGSFDGHGNYTFGVTEQLIFPEVDYDKVPAVRGLDIAITTSATSDEHGRALLGALGMPFAAGRREQ
jgi:large subunit ribosomal protein L5